MYARQVFKIFYLICILNYAHALPVEKINESKEIVDRYFSYEISYPQFQEQSKSIKWLNNTIDIKVKDFFSISQINLLSAQQQKKIADSGNFKLNSQSNNIKIVYEIITNNNNMISILFTKTSYFLGSPHPNTDFLTINFDLKNIKLLDMKDLFPPTFNYLLFLSKIARNKLEKKLINPFDTADTSYLKQQINKGTQPEKQNFNNWCFSSKGLKLFFPPYQVADYVHGPQEIIIPYKNLANNLNSYWKNNLLLTEVKT